MPHPLSRRRFLKSASVGIAATVVGPAGVAAAKVEPATPASLTPRSVLNLLTEGNAACETATLRVEPGSC